MSLYDRDYMRPSGSSWNLKGWRLDAFQCVFWLNIAVFVFQYVLGFGMENHGGVSYPKGGVSLELLSEGKILGIFTYMFVHGSLGHVLINMVMLWFVGRQVYQIFGAAHFLFIYLLGGLFGAALEIAVQAWSGNPTGPLVGASASVFALFLALAVTLPNEVFTALIYFVVPVRVRMWKLAAFVVGLNVILGLVSLIWPSTGGGPATAYFAHLGGALTGWYYIRMLGFGGNPMTYRQLWQRKASTPKDAPRLELVPTRKRRAVDLEMDQKALRKRNLARTTPADDLIRDEVDPILDKISALGFQSLTDEELRTLDRASKLVPQQGKKP